MHTKKARVAPYFSQCKNNYFYIQAMINKYFVKIILPELSIQIYNNAGKHKHDNKRTQMVAWGEK